VNRVDNEPFRLGKIHYLNLIATALGGDDNSGLAMIIHVVIALLIRRLRVQRNLVALLKCLQEACGTYLAALTHGLGELVASFSDVTTDAFGHVGGKDGRGIKRFGLIASSGEII